MSFAINATDRLVQDLLNKTAQAVEMEITGQLNELISRGLLIVVQQGPTVTQDPFSMKVSVRTAIKLELKDQAYIEKLELRNKHLEGLLERITEAAR